MGVDAGDKTSAEVNKGLIFSYSVFKFSLTICKEWVEIGYNNTLIYCLNYFTIADRREDDYNAPLANASPGQVAESGIIYMNAH